MTQPTSKRLVTEAAQTTALAGKLDSAGLDAASAALVGNPASTTGAALSATYAAVVGLPAGNGTDDTSAINALLATAAGKVVRGLHGQAYKISAPLIVQSGTTLDMTGCTITLNAASDTRMLENRAHSTSVRAISNAAMTSGGTTLTATGGAFTSADIGRSIVVTGAASGAGPLCALVTAVTNSTTVTLSVAATATTSTGTATLYDRDSDITIRGGTWNRGANSGSAFNRHSLVFRRVDRLTVEKLRFTSTAGKYAIYPGDVTECRVRDISLAAFSDGIHIQGPARNVIVEGITGSAGDDCVAVGNTDYVYNDVFGDVTDVVISEVSCTKTNGTALVKLYGAAGMGGVLGAAGGAAGTVIRNVRITNLSGTSTGVAAPAVATDIDGFFDEITIDGVTTRSENSAVVLASKDSIGLVRLKNIGHRVTSATNHGVLLVNTGAIVEKIIAEGCSLNFAGTAGQMFRLAGSVTHLQVVGCSMKATTGSAAMVRIDSGTVARLLVSDNIADLQGGHFVDLNSGATVTVLQAVGNYVTTPPGGSFMRLLGTCPRAFLSGNVAYSTPNGIGDFGGTTEVYLNNHAVNTGNAVNLRATAVVTILGDGPLYTNGTTLLATTAGYSLRVNHRAFPVDITKVTTKSNGDQALNTNAAHGAGVGPLLSDGTSWKNLYTGTAA